MSVNLIRAGLSSTRNELAEVFPHLNDDILDWAPAHGMRTIKGQFTEIIGTEISILESLAGDELTPFAVTEESLKALSSVSELLNKLAEVRAITLGVLEPMTQEELEAPVKISEGFAKYLELAAVPASELFRFLIRHEAYHTGQLVSYLWARGNNPYTWE